MFQTPLLTNEVEEGLLGKCMVWRSRRSVKEGDEDIIFIYFIIFKIFVPEGLSVIFYTAYP